MAGTNRKPLFPNPFYFFLLIVSVLFVITIFAYLVIPYYEMGLMNHPELKRKPSNQAFSDWLDRSGPLIIGIEFVIMLVLSVIAMLADDKFDRTNNDRDADRNKK
jgi:magnesium-transporting ATPase (P-type)